VEEARTTGDWREPVPFQVIPRGSDFYELFERAAGGVADGASLLAKLLTDFKDPETAHAEIRDLEHEGDETTHQILRELNTSFVTPFDREDIHQLASGLDDILDGVEAVADMFVLHHIKQPLPEMRQQADVLHRAAEELRQAMSDLRNLRALEEHWVEINRLENEGDRVYRKTVAALFSGDYKAMDVLKWKDIVDQLEGAIDGCEDVANILESIVLKHA
jgi:uncharacterized protein